jgi:hypothetical protein
MVAFDSSEYRAIVGAIVKNADSLLHDFLLDYPKLHTVRHNQQVVHSLYHVGQSISDYMAH